MYMYMLPQTCTSHHSYHRNVLLASSYGERGYNITIIVIYFFSLEIPLVVMQDMYNESETSFSTDTVNQLLTLLVSDTSLCS